MYICTHIYHNLHVKPVVSGRVGRVFVAQIRDVARRDAVDGGVLQEPTVRSGHRPGSRGKRRRRRAHQACRCGGTALMLGSEGEGMAIVRAREWRRTARLHKAGRGVKVVRTRGTLSVCNSAGQ